MNGKRDRMPPRFGSRMTRGEIIAALLYLPVHLWLLPTLLMSVPETASLSELDINTVVFAFGAVWMLVLEGRFLRRDFDPLCDAPGFCLLQILIHYGMLFGCNLLLGVLFRLLPVGANPNNDAVVDMALAQYGRTAALAVFLAPLVEEPLFRGGIFHLLLKKSRFLAYAGSMLLFSLYHVWGYALQEPVYWLFILQYLPASWLLCRCYERCGSIWGSIFLHMLINAVSVSALTTLAEAL